LLQKDVRLRKEALVNSKGFAAGTALLCSVANDAAIDDSFALRGNDFEDRHGVGLAEFAGFLFQYFQLNPCEYSFSVCGY